MSSRVCSWHFCDFRSCPLHGRFGGKADRPRFSRRPRTAIRRERPSSADADGDALVVRTGLCHNPLPSRPRTLTEQALWKPVIEQISTFKPASK
jgi:hypothetical protein